MEAKRIVILLNTLSPGGAEKQALLLSKLLRARGHSITIAVLRPELIDEVFVNRTLNPQTHIEKLHGNFFSKAQQLYKLFTEEKTQVLFNYLLLPNTLGGIMGRLAGVQLIVGGIRNAELNPKKELLERFVHNSISHATIFNNHAGMQQLGKKGFNTAKSAVIHNGFDLKEPLIERAKPSTPTIITVARFIEQKDHFTALQTIKNLHAAGKKFKYVLVGWGHLENDIRNWIEAHNLQQTVEVVVNPPNIPDLLRAADIFFSTSLFEGVPNAVMEAMSFSLPVVATNAGDMKYLVLENENGYVTETKDCKALEAHLSKLIGAHDKRLALGKQGYQKLKAAFGPQPFVEKYEQFMSKRLKG